MVVLAEEHPLVRNVVRRANRAPSIAAFEAALVVCCSIHRNLLNGVNCLFTAHTLVSGSGEEAGNLGCVLF